MANSNLHFTTSNSRTYCNWIHSYIHTYCTVYILSFVSYFVCLRFRVTNTLTSCTSMCVYSRIQALIICDPTEFLLILHLVLTEPDMFLPNFLN